MTPASTLDVGKLRPSDARARRSQNALRDAFIELVEIKPFEQITLREITLRAGVSYPTFFRNFASKEDLLGTIAIKQLRQVLDLMGSNLDPERPDLAADAVCAHVDRHRTLWRTLVAAGAASKVREELLALTRAYATEHGRVNPEIPLELVSSMVVGSLFELLAWWMRQPADYPVANVSKFMQVLLLVPTTTRHDLKLR